MYVSAQPTAIVTPTYDMRMYTTHTCTHYITCYNDNNIRMIINKIYVFIYVFRVKKKCYRRDSTAAIVMINTCDTCVIINNTHVCYIVCTVYTYTIYAFVRTPFRLNPRKRIRVIK